MTNTICSVLAVTVAIAGVASSQTIQVPEDFADLQDALDAAPPDATIVVHGGSYFELEIKKPVRIVGDPAPMIWGDGPGIQMGAPITLAGPGSGDVVLSNLQVGMFVDAFAWRFSSPGIQGGGFDALYVFDSIVTGPEWSFVYNWIFDGVAAVETTVPFLWFERCVVRGSDTQASQVNVHSAFSNLPGSLGVPAGTAIVANGTVVVLDSTVSGGDGDRISYMYPLGDEECPGGDGGGGVVCGTLIHAGSRFSGGRPSDWYDNTGITYWCSGEKGVPIVAHATVDLATDLRLSGPLRLGQQVTVGWTTPGPGLLALSLGPPVLRRPGTGLFLDPGSVQLLDTRPDTPFRVLQVPTTASLVGSSVVFQRLVEPFGWSRPVAGVVGP